METEEVTQLAFRWTGAGATTPREIPGVVPPMSCETHRCVDS